MQAKIHDFRHTLTIPITVDTGCDLRPWTITLDDNDGRGSVTIRGEDFTCAYDWPHRGGRSLPAFLFSLGLDYLADKMDADRHFDARATERAAAAWLAEAITDAGDFADPADFGDLLSPRFTSVNDWHEWCREVDAHGISEAFYSGVVYVVRPDFRVLYDAVWPTLRARVGGIEAALYGVNPPS